jgi:hypothetical protein
MIMESRYISIDIETTGLNPKCDQVLELAAIIDDWKSPVEQLPAFHCYVKHDVYHGDAYAINLNARIFKILADPQSVKPQRVVHSLANPTDQTLTIALQGVTRINFILKPEEVAGYFVEWLRENRINKFTAAGKNFGIFDYQFLKELPNSSILTSRMHHRSIDPAILFWDPTIDGSKLPNLDECLKRAGVKIADTEMVIPKQPLGIRKRGQRLRSKKI